MAALLSSVLDNGQKIAEYTAECRDLGLALLPPDVNESQSGFSVSGGNIRFGLAAIKGIGRNAVGQLEAERKAGGPFRSFEDFLRRMNGKDFNRRAVENLAKAGGFDSFGYKRKALVIVAASMIDSISRENRDNISGQIDLFGGWEEEDTKDASPQDSLPIPDMDDFTPRERMALEKEMTGLYLSGHPMDEYRQSGLVRLGWVRSSAIFPPRTAPGAFPTTSPSRSPVSSTRTEPAPPKTTLSCATPSWRTTAGAWSSSSSRKRWISADPTSSTTRPSWSGERSPSAMKKRPRSWWTPCGHSQI